MTDEIKQAYDFAQKEIKKEQEEALKNKIKGIVKETLEKIDNIDKEEKKLAERKKILKKDIDDLRAGRLDLIEERHKESQLAKDTSVFRVVLKEIHYPPQWSSYRLILPDNGTGITTYCNGWTTSTYTGGTYNINGQVKFL